MSQKHLHELLEEEQEPFKLKNYIADKRCQVKKSSLNTQLQAKKRKHVGTNSSFNDNICRNACFLAYKNTQEVTKSPLFEFSSPAKSSNVVFIHVPAKTSAVLLEAAMRIHKNSALVKTKNRNAGFGMFGSLLKMLKQKGKTQKSKIQSDPLKMSVNDIVSKNMKKKCVKNASEVSNGRLSCAGWSDSNEEKSFETSSSGSHFGEFCDSPFHPVLQRSLSSGRRRPELSSPVASPGHQKIQDKDVKNLSKLQGGEEQDEKEQCSPVSVMDPPFEDDEDAHDSEDSGGYDMECSYEFVQRAKQQLLQKLCRLEKLAELDPVELEKRILEQDHDNYDDDDEAIDGKEEDNHCGNDEDIVFEVLGRTSLFKQQKVSRDIKSLISDLVSEDVQQQSCGVDREEAVKRVCKRLESWNDVEFNTIDMMVEQDLMQEHVSWKNHQDQVGETASQVELDIFGLLVEELAEELGHYMVAK